VARFKRGLIAEAVEGVKKAARQPDTPDKTDPKKTVRDLALQRALDLLEGQAELLTEAPLSFDQRKDRVTISLGLGDGEPLRLAAPFAGPVEKRKLEEELIAHAKTLKAPFKEGVTVEGLIADFLKEAAKKP